MSNVRLVGFCRRNQQNRFHTGYSGYRAHCHELTDYTYNMCLEVDIDAHLEAETENVFLIAFGKRQRVEHVPQHGVIVLHVTREISIMN